MSQRSKNQEKVNSKLMELNRKFIPEYDVILNTAPPRVGKTINTILYHIENKIPAIVFIDNKEQYKDIKEDIKEIDEEYLRNVYYWKSKRKLCYICLNKDSIIEKEGLEFFETLKFKYKNNINICENCKYTKDCKWKSQRTLIKMYSIVLMNKANIFTPIVDIRNSRGKLDVGNIFYHNDLDKVIDESIDYDCFDEDSRTIIYDEKIEEVKTIEYQRLKENDFELLNKIIELKKPELKTTIHTDTSFINEIKNFRDIFIDHNSVATLLEESDIDFTFFGKYEKNIYINIFLQKIRTNIEVYDYIKKKSPHLLHTDGGKSHDWRFFTCEKLYINAFFERNKILKSMEKYDEINKIILLDATPLESIVEMLKSMEGFKEINLKHLEIFDKNSSLLRISREGTPSLASRDKIKKRIFKKNAETNVLEDKTYRVVIETGKYIEEFKKRKNIKFGTITYKQLKRHEKDKNPVKPCEELEKALENISTLYFGNSRGRSELNDCELVYILGTDRIPSISMYGLYRYFGGMKTWEELENNRVKGKVEKLTYKDKIFNEIINHQIDSEMEQVIFRNMPHMKKRLIVLEGHLPEKLKGYFKEVASINMKPTTEKLLFPIVIKEFIKALHPNKKFNFQDVNKIAELSFENDNKKIISEYNKRIKEERIKKVIKLINEYRNKPEEYRYERIHELLKEKYPELLKNAGMSSFSSFKNKYFGKK